MILYVFWMACGFLLTIGGMLLFMPPLIEKLRVLKFGQTEREEGLESHKKKTGTPTMGGIAFVAIPFLVYLILCLTGAVRLTINAAIVWTAFMGYGLIGFLDDYIIAVKKDNTGLKPWIKFALQSLLAVSVFGMYLFSGNPMTIHIPATDINLNLSYLYFLMVFFMFTGCSNAVNLADGVDGLCAGLSAIALVPFFIFGLIQDFNIAAIALFVIAGLLGYLVFNLHPAKVFMGDTGSLALGGLLAAMSMVLKTELLLIVIGGVFVAETLSVILQVGYYKRTKKRIFLMAPVHHHFEKKGWDENKVVRVFWCWGILFALLGLVIGVIL